MLTWAHVGDLHVSHEDDYLGIQRLRVFKQEANRYLAGAIDFVFLPGDNANNGTPQQYHRIGEVLNDLAVPIHAIPGDHDFEPGNLDAFRRMPGAGILPKFVELDGRRCLFLDVVSAGAGGPDFRLGSEQLRWLEHELARPVPVDRRPTVFMHAYPGDLPDDGEYLARLFASARVAMVDTGHTHYNELLNDGAVVYASTRSTAQVEEDHGEAGFSLAVVDGTAVSWRFKPLGSSWPFVLITSPADHRLMTDVAWHEPMPRETLVVRAKVFGENIRAVTVSIDLGKPIPMHAVEGESAVWSACVPVPPTGLCAIVVRAQSADGRIGKDRIDVPMEQTCALAIARSDAPPGTDAHAVKPWPEHGVLGSQLGPNKHGRKW